MAGPCETCAAPCCRELVVLPTADDIARLVAALRVPPLTFVQLARHHTVEDSFRIRLFRPPAAFHRIELRKSFWRCTFLVEGEPCARCGVYAARPLACRTFPTQPDGVTLVPLSRRLCGPGAWDAAPPDPDEHRTLHRQRAAEEARMDAFVAAWHAHIDQDDREHSAEELFAFLVAAAV